MLKSCAGASALGAALAAFGAGVSALAIGFTLDLFHTKLDRAFYLRSVGEDMFGERFLKVNGQGAFVEGITVESRLNLYGKVQWEAGFTAQRSLYVNPVIWMDAVKPMRSFIRTPNISSPTERK